MRDFFIQTAEKLIAVFVVLMLIAVFVGGLGSIVAPSYQGGGFLMGLLIWVFGGLYVVIMGGLLYLGFGIYRNTLRTAELLEKTTRQ